MTGKDDKTWWACYDNSGTPVIVERRNIVTGTIVEKKQKSGSSYLYVKLSYKDPDDQRWKQKVIGTGLTARGNKKKAAEMIPELIQKYRYLEQSNENLSTAFDRNVTLADYAKHWLSDGKNGWEISTYEGYETRVQKIVDYFGKTNLKLAEATPHDIDVFVKYLLKYLLKYGKINQKTHENEPLAVRSVRAVKSILFSIYSQAAIDGLVTSNPVMSVKVRGKNDHDYEEEMLFLTEEECSEFLHFLASDEHPEFNRLTPMAFFGIYYGLRRSELLGLKWSAIRYDKGMIRIDHTVIQVKTYVAKDRTKTSSSFRELALFDTALECLQKLKDEQEKEKTFWGKDYKNPNDYIFTWEDGRLYNPDYISKAFVKAANAFGRPEITFHKLRHTCASLLIEKGWDVKKVQYWMGHADTKTTLKIYAHFNRHRLNSAPDDLTELSASCKELFK